MRKLNPQLKLRNAVLDALTDVYDVLESDAKRKLSGEKLQEAIYILRHSRLESIASTQCRLDVLFLDLKSL